MAENSDQDDIFTDILEGRDNESTEEDVNENREKNSWGIKYTYVIIGIAILAVFLILLYFYYYSSSAAEKIIPNIIDKKNCFTVKEVATPYTPAPKRRVEFSPPAKDYSKDYSRSFRSRDYSRLADSPVAIPRYNSNGHLLGHDVHV